MVVMMVRAYMLFMLRLHRIMLLFFLFFLQILLTVYFLVNNCFRMLVLSYSSFISICRLILLRFVLFGSFHLGDMIEQLEVFKIE